MFDRWDALRTRAKQFRFMPEVVLWSQLADKADTGT